MMERHITGAAAVALGVILTGTLGFSQTKQPTEGPAAGGSPAWFLQGSFPDPTGRTIVSRAVVSPSPAATLVEGAAPPVVVQAPLRAECRDATTRLCAGDEVVCRGSRCSASSGNKPWATRSSIRSCCLRVWRRAVGRARFKGQPLGVSTPIAASRSSSSSIAREAHPSGWRGRDRLPGESAWHRPRRGQRLDYRRRQRHDTAGGKSFTVTQAAAACCYSISSTSQSADPSGGAVA